MTEKSTFIEWIKVIFIFKCLEDYNKINIVTI